MAYSVPLTRGTVDYLKYAVQRNEAYPPYWHTRGERRHQKDMPIPVDDRTKDVIKALVRNTWNPQETRRARDGTNLNYSNLVVQDVERLENFELFDNYAFTRRAMMKRQIREGVVCPAVETVCGSIREVETTRLLRGQMPFMEDLYLEVNEHYLFHGTTAKRIDYITSGGFDCGLSDTSKMDGIFLTENTNTADFHADPREDGSPPGQPLKMILCRTLLGKVRKFEGISEINDLTRSEWDFSFDSALYKPFKYRGFAVFNDKYLYPEYIITYIRE